MIFAKMEKCIFVSTLSVRQKPTCITFYLVTNYKLKSRNNLPRKKIGKSTDCPTSDLVLGPKVRNLKFSFCKQFFITTTFDTIFFLTFLFFSELYLPVCEPWCRLFSFYPSSWSGDPLSQI
jgi:hypothetical protein